MKPLLKWPGGKRFLAPLIARHFRDSRTGRYVEPFAGGAAVFFEIEPPDAILADTNAELINLYEVVRDSPEDIIARLQRLKNSGAAYYTERNRGRWSKIGRAVRLYYLQRLSFNGIYRENLSGEFNVPYGKKKHLRCVDPKHVFAASRVLTNCKLLCQDFRKTLELVGSDDFVYVDPPYTVMHNNNGFIKYNSRLFSWQDQLDLATACIEAAKRGARVIVSNANHDEVTRLYHPAFDSTELNRTSVIAASSWARRSVSEALLFSK